MYDIRVKSSKKPFVLARLGFGAWDPQKHEDAAIFKENQRIRMVLELRKLHSNGAIRGHHMYIIHRLSRRIAAGPSPVISGEGCGLYKGGQKRHVSKGIRRLV